MVASYEFVVDADSGRVRDLVVGVIDGTGFDVSWFDEWNGVVSQGSRVKSVLLGAFSPYVRIDVAIRTLAVEAGKGGTDESDDRTDESVAGADESADDRTEAAAADADERSVVRLDNRASGLWGGVMGAQKSRAGWGDLRRALAERFAAAGLLVEERDPGPSQIM